MKLFTLLRSALGPQRTFTYKERGRTPPGRNGQSIILANDVVSDVVVVMSIAFFAKGFGNIDWCILSDTSPKEILGAVSCLFITEPLKRLQIDPPTRRKRRNSIRL